MCWLDGKVGSGTSEVELCLAARILERGEGKMNEHAAVQSVAVQFISVLSTAAEICSPLGQWP